MPPIPAEAYSLMHRSVLQGLLVIVWMEISETFLGIGFTELISWGTIKEVIILALRKLAYVKRKFPRMIVSPH